MKIEKLYTYPVKALRAVELDSVQVTKHGFPHDRRFMVLQVLKEDDGSVKYKNIHVAHFPESVRFFPSLDLEGERVKITYKPANGGEEKNIDFPLYPETDDLETVEVDMHKSPTNAYKMPQKYNDWFSSCYGFDVILTHLGRNYRKVLMSTSHNKQNPSKSSTNSWLSSITSTATSYLTGTNKENDTNILTFNDCAPYLIASSRSMDDLHHRLASPSTQMDILKFRPNIIVRGRDSHPWEEDTWKRIRISTAVTATESLYKLDLDVVARCARCQVPNVNPDTAEKHAKQPWDTLMKFRRVDDGGPARWKPCFGMMCIPKNEGVVAVGGTLEVLETTSNHLYSLRPFKDL